MLHLLRSALLVIVFFVGTLLSFAQDAPTIAVIQDGALTLVGINDVDAIPLSSDIVRSHFLRWSPDRESLVYTHEDDLYLLQTGEWEPLLLVADVRTGFPATWNADSNSVYFMHPPEEAPTTTQDAEAGYTFLAKVSQINIETGEITDVGYLDAGIGCGGGSNNLAYLMQLVETESPLLEWTPYGLIYSATCSGNPVEMLTFRGERILLLPEGNTLHNVRVSADGRYLAGVQSDVNYDRTAVVIDLETMASYTLDAIPTELFEMNANPRFEVFAWGTDGTLFYTTQKREGSLVEDVAGVPEIWSGEPPQWYTSQIWQTDREGSEPVMIYEAAAYSISRMQVASNGQTLYFSQVSNSENWVDAVIHDGLDPHDFDPATLYDLIPVTLHAIDLESGEQEMIGSDLRQFALQPAP